jgi:hypothetical protein
MRANEIAKDLLRKSSILRFYIPPVPTMTLHSTLICVQECRASWILSGFY